jgi:hypothetical protein
MDWRLGLKLNGTQLNGTQHAIGGTWQKRSRERDQGLRLENEETTLQMPQAVHHIAWSNDLINIHVTFVIVYGVATISRLLKIIGLFCRISSLL